MTRLNKAQQRALLAVYNRAPMYRDAADCRSNKRITYREFRKTVQPGFLCDCIMVPWAGMWLGIELDGYTHS